MELPRRDLLRLAVGAAALPAISRVAKAQAYPTRPVRIIVTFAAGASNDLHGRLHGQWLSERLGQPFIVENRPGGGGNLGAAEAIRSRPDGYTLFLLSTSHAINASLHEKLPYDIVRDISPIASLFQANQATVELRKRQLQDARIPAPFSGVVGSRSVSPGQVIAKNTTLTWLMDIETVKAEFNVPERILGEVKPGQQIELRVAAFPKERFKGEVYFLAPQIDPNTRTLLMKARVPNPKHLLRPGMFVNLDLTLTLREKAIMIPESAVMSMGERTMVYVVAGDATAQMRPVKIGLRLPNQIEIVDGLKAGEKVVAEGVQKVRPGAPVIIATPVASGTNVGNAR